ncbi:MAG: glutaredoxin family protein [Actinomycetota bacterium]|nr:glutaredoxin family protein [Actinomycetota bacterium]
MKLTLYMRPGCHLCDDARTQMLALGLTWDEVDIDGDDVLQEKFFLRIPVIELDGRIVAEGNLSGLPLGELLRTEANR